MRFDEFVLMRFVRFDECVLMRFDECVLMRFVHFDECVLMRITRRIFLHLPCRVLVRLNAT